MKAKLLKPYGRIKEGSIYHLNGKDFFYSDGDISTHVDYLGVRNHPEMFEIIHDTGSENST